MKEDELIQTRFGKKNPFNVPEDYFEQFATRMMEQLPPLEQQSTLRATSIGKRTFYGRIRPYLYLAAMSCGLFFGIQIYHYQVSRMESNQTIATSISGYSGSEEDIDALCDYADIDHYDIYACVTKGI